VLNQGFHPFTQICIPLYQYKLKLIKCKILQGFTGICKNTGEKTGNIYHAIYLKISNSYID
jgi:hypothetical protein